MFKNTGKCGPVKALTPWRSHIGLKIVSMIRRGSVIVSFLFGALFFREKNLKAKAFDLALVLLGMIFLYIGSK